MTIEELRKGLGELALDEARAAKLALEGGRHEDARDYFRNGEVLLEARSVLAGYMDMQVRGKTETPTPCPDCHRKDGSKCKEGAVSGPGLCVCGHDVDAHSGHGLRPCRQVVCEINCCEYREAP
jgi:hypothetical protein